MVRNARHRAQTYLFDFTQRYAMPDEMEGDAFVQGIDLVVTAGRVHLQCSVPGRAERRRSYERQK